MTRMSRTLLALPIVFALMLFAVPAIAAETTTGYGQTAPKPSSGTGPSRETATPKTTTSTPAANKTATPSSTTAPSIPVSSRSTLPFTGLDLRWVLGAGLLLLGAGLSIRFLQRRQRHDLGR
jgi:hypothetical protein